jgi:hypothetical protein
MYVFIDVGDDRYTNISIKVLRMRYLQVLVNECHIYVFSFSYAVTFETLLSKNVGGET